MMSPSPACLPALALVLTLALAAAAGGAAQAKEYNKRSFIPPGQRAKLNNAIAQTWMVKATTGQGQGLVPGGLNARVVNTSCGSLEVGALPDGKKAPREQIIIAGDIINVNQNCRSRR